MKKIIYFLIDLFLLVAAVFYSVFKFKKLVALAGNTMIIKKQFFLEMAHL